MRWAVEQLHGPLSSVRVSNAHESPPWGDPTGPPFLNAVLLGSTSWSPEGLLAFGKALEHSAGRRRGARWADRPLDVDLLFYGDLVRRNPELTLPHRRRDERLFVLVPWAELDSAVRLDEHRRSGAEWPLCRGPL